MNNSFKDIVEIISDFATIFAFIWAMYEFYYKRRFKIKATGSPSTLNLKTTEYFFDFEVINLSEQSLKRIDKIGIWITRWNSYGQFWDIALQDVGYQEKTRFTQDIFNFMNAAIKQCMEEQTFMDQIFKPRLKIILKTTMEREIEVNINEFYSDDIDQKIVTLCHQDR